MLMLTFDSFLKLDSTMICSKSNVNIVLLSAVVVFAFAASFPPLRQVYGYGLRVHKAIITSTALEMLPSLHPCWT